LENDAKHVIDHYQKTYELTFSLWEGRNNIFLTLLGLVGVATLVAFPALGTRSIVFLYLGHSIGLKETELLVLQNGFPFGLLQAIFLFLILYLTVNLYHRARYVLRNYAYLSALETEIRQMLGLGEGAAAFTRESTFYWGHRDTLSGAVKYVYIVLLGGLLLSLLFTLIVSDWRSGNLLLSVVDMTFAVPTLTFLYGFAISSVSMDRKHATDSESQAASRTAPNSLFDSTHPQ
jgi:hypothetical protein